MVVVDAPFGIVDASDVGYDKAAVFVEAFPVAGANIDAILSDLEIPRAAEVDRRPQKSCQAEGQKIIGMTGSRMGDE